MKKLGLAALVMFTLAGCGGGGGSTGPSTPEPPPPPPPPTTQFALDSTSPADNATGVARTAAFTATFSNPLAATSVNGFTARMLGPEGNPIDISALVNGSQLKLQAGLGLPGNTRYTVNLGSAISDSAGHTLPSAITRTFTTAPQAWDAAAKAIASLPSFDAGQVPLLAADAQGNVTAAWATVSPGGDSLHAARMDASGGTWAPDATIFSAAPGSVGGVSLAPGANGDLYLTWIERGASASDARARMLRYDGAAGAWKPAADVPGTPSGGVPQAIRLVADPSGKLTALVRVLTAPGAIAEYATRYEAITGWGTPQAIFTSGANADNAMDEQVVVDGNGSVTVAWRQFTASGPALTAARYDAFTASWSAAQVLDANVNSFSLSADSLGLVTLGWVRNNGMASAPTVEAARFDPLAKTWSAPARLDNAAASSNGGWSVRVVTDDAGFATAAWVQGEGIAVARFSPTAGWSAPQVLPASTPATGLALGVDVAGNVMLASGDGQRVYAWQYLAGDDQWHARSEIGVPDGATPVFAGGPAIVVDGAGTVTAAWPARDSASGAAQYVIAANRFR